MSIKFKPVTHCIFDMDGLLLDTEGLYHQLTQEIIDRYHKNPRKFYTIEIQAQMMGIPIREEGKRIAEIFDLPFTPDEYVEMVRKEIPELMKNCQKCKGAESLIKHLHSHKIPICVATASGRESFAAKSTNHKEFFKLFNHILLGGTDDEVKHGKPAPDIFLIAAKRFNDNVKPENCLVFEDAPNGLKAAIAAGMQCVMIPDPNISDKHKNGATLVLNSLDDFKPEDFGLPARN
ncbi:hypothetical protein PVAND_014821 [Polypedilum vanderplanki]|uniref:Uncharacterized protein n=1 Tax=Polypedilum vanderplanki TaxID=319348 RepID=A0A9J6BBB0_POLVA|nr:hypothetical protein PVAND_014821 [Polypedilum vanderplanki]